MSTENVRFLLSIEVNVDDPLSVEADQLEFFTDKESGELVPVAGIGRDIEEKIGVVAIEAALTRLRDLPGVTVIGGGILPWKKAEDGSFPEMTLPRMMSRAEMEEWSRRHTEEGTDEG